MKPLHRNILKEGVAAWNLWRQQNPNVRPDLSDAQLTGADLKGGNFAKVNFARSHLSKTDLSGADLSGACLRAVKLGHANLTKASMPKAKLDNANLKGACLNQANLQSADLTQANLSGARLAMANLTEADLTEVWAVKADLTDSTLTRARLAGANLNNACLHGAALIEADLSNASLISTDASNASFDRACLARCDLADTNLYRAGLCGASLEQAHLVRTRLERADLTASKVYGISAWDLELAGANQRDLIITPENKVTITLDNLEVAQFVYLLLNNEKVRDVLDTISTKTVLILGRFTPERKVILDAIREELRRRNFVPILFDFEKPTRRDITETVSTLAHMAKFVIADITHARSVPQELQRIVPDLPSVPIQPILEASDREYGMFEHFKKYPWVLAVHQYRDLADLLTSLPHKVIAPAEMKANELNQ